MCGIFGIIGQNAVSSTLRALKLLEYRGYDSAGIAVKREGFLEICKTEGRIVKLQQLAQSLSEGRTAIGHTRWATHGEVSTANAHPFLSPNGKFAIVHNGILENYAELKSQLGKEKFTSQTDSEVVAHLLEREHRGNVLETVLTVSRMLKGSFAIVVLSTEDNKLFAIKNKSPLVVGFSQTGSYLCSDIRCVAHWANSVAVTPDNTVVELSDSSARFFTLDGAPLKVDFFVPEAGESLPQTDGDLMLKEITEIPDKLRRAKQAYFDGGGLQLTVEQARKIRRIYLVGCGTAYNSGMQAISVARQWLDVDAIPVIAGEFIYDNYPVDGDTLSIFISQSGETADTLRAAERVREMGGITYAVTNTAGSSLTFACRHTINIGAGGEFAVASTKAYNCQLVSLTLLLLDLGRMRGTVPFSFYSKLVEEMDALPDAVSQILEESYLVARLAERVKDCSAVFYIGRTTDYPTACEGSLKLKEISYIHSEAYPAGELKHGTLALIDDSVCVVAISTDKALKDKMVSSVKEVTSRGAKAISVAPYELPDCEPLLLPALHPALAGIVAAVPLQLLAYYVAKRLGRDVDKPRNLAKSVTVE